MVGSYGTFATSALSGPRTSARREAWRAPRASYKPQSPAGRAIRRVMKTDLIVELEAGAGSGISRERAAKMSKEARLHAYAAHDPSFYRGVA